MAKSELKTQQTSEDPRNFLNTLSDRQQREDSFKIVELMKSATGEEPKMWGPAIVGFGHRLLKYDSGRELEWMEIGFSPRKANISLYIGIDNDDFLAATERLGKYKTGKGCLYIKRISDIDVAVLEELLNKTVARLRRV